MEIEYKLLSDLENIDECLRMAEDHYSGWQEGGSELSFDLDHELLKKLHSTGNVEAVVAFDDGEPVGYLLALVTLDILTKKTSGQLIALYTHPDYRGDGVATGLINLFEEVLTANGDALCVLTFKIGNETMLPEKLGYTKSDISFVKSLKGE